MRVVTLSHLGPSPHLPQGGSCKGPVKSLVPDVSELRGPLEKEMENEYLLVTFTNRPTAKKGKLEMPAL